jgi:lipopolysaccharide export LptBFGC system permease protein LptF
LPIPTGIPMDIKDSLNKIAMFFGSVIIIYAVLWILIKLNLIPTIVFAIFPQIVLLLIGIFIFYTAYNARKRNY